MGQYTQHYIYRNKLVHIVFVPIILFTVLVWVGIAYLFFFRELWSRNETTNCSCS